MALQHYCWPLLVVTSLLGRGGHSLERSPCDSLVPEYCGLPYPNSYFTVKSSETATGVRLNLSTQAFPKNSLGISVDPAMWNTFGINNKNFFTFIRVLEDCLSLDTASSHMYVVMYNYRIVESIG